MNVNLYAACTNPECTHDFKVEPDERFSLGAGERLFAAACDNCGTIANFVVRKVTVINELTTAKVAEAFVVIDDLRGGFDETSATEAEEAKPPKKVAKK